MRVALKAAGVNFPDVLMIQGLYQHRPELPFVPGLEAAGVVSEVAADVAGIAVGQKVIAQMRTGGYAEEAVVPAGAIRPMPEGFSFEEGCDVPGGAHDGLARAQDPGGSWRRDRRCLCWAQRAGWGSRPCRSASCSARA